MKITYFHGRGESFDETKYKILSKFGDEVLYPDINFNDKNLISNFSQSIEPSLIVGSSMGGYIGYHVSNMLSCPALLINPSIFFKSGAEFRPNDNIRIDQRKHFIISQKDEIIDIKRTLKFLNEFNFKDDSIKIHNELISLDVFEKEFNVFREKYINFSNEQTRKRLDDYGYGKLSSPYSFNIGSLSEPSPFDEDVSNRKKRSKMWEQATITSNSTSTSNF